MTNFHGQNHHIKYCSSIYYTFRILGILDFFLLPNMYIFKQINLIVVSSFKAFTIFYSMFLLIISLTLNFSIFEKILLKIILIIYFIKLISIY